MSRIISTIKTPARVRVLNLLKDCAWHTWQELEEVGGNRYGARLHELQAEGYVIERRGTKHEGLSYRLTSLMPGPAVEPQVRVYLDAADAKALLNGTLTPTGRKAIAAAIKSYAESLA